MSAPSEYVFEGEFPTAETIERAYDDADLNRAIQAYRFFFPTVSGIAMFVGNEAAARGLFDPGYNRFVAAHVREAAAGLTDSRLKTHAEFRPTGAT